MKGLLTTVRELFRYRGQEGQLAWMGHRLSGLGTVLFFTFHVIDTSWAFFWPEGYVHALKLYKHPLFLLGEMVLVLAVLYHAINGLRVVLMDFFPELWQYQRRLTIGGFVLVGLLYTPAFLIMGAHMLQGLDIL
ncbi:MAG: succinate dehydrogenase, cytochrome b556 subunit [Anaerolineae bacterium]|nr:succinate dehydrogenase, cytochrome b556 subunit [Anaerolineae bacterium]